MDNQSWRRRDVLAALGAGAITAALPPASFAAGAYKPRRIDVHHHVLPPAYNKFVESGQSLFRSPLDISWWTLEGAIRDMDKAGIATSIVSWPELNGRMPGDFLAVVRECNEWCAGLARDYPGRFGSFATLPYPNVDACLAEIAYAYDTLKVDGMRSAPSYQGKYLGHADFRPILEELNRRKAVVFIHPTQPACCGVIVPEAPSATLEFPFDTTRCITDLLVSGSFAQFPDIKWIFSHGGGTLPMLAGRIADNLRFNKRIGARTPKGAMYEFKKLYVDTASSYFPTSMAGMMALSGGSHILFGTDDPYIRVAETDEGMRALHLDPKLRAAIDRENALPLFPRLKKA